MIRPVSSTRDSTETHAARSTSTKEKKLTSPPSRRSFAKRSPSTVLAGRNLRRKRSPEGFYGGPKLEAPGLYASDRITGPSAVAWPPPKALLGVLSFLGALAPSYPSWRGA